MKVFLVVLGFVAALMIVAQLVMGLLIANGGDARLIKIHQHSGYLAVGVSLVYILLSLSRIIAAPDVRSRFD